MQNSEQSKTERFTIETLRKSVEDAGYKLNIKKPQTNFDWLVETVCILRNSQGFYNRL